MGSPAWQQIVESYNKGIIFSFTVETTAATAIDVVTAEQVAENGGAAIRDIQLKVTGGEGRLGLGKVAVVTLGKDIIPVYKGTFFGLENCNYASLSLIRKGIANVTVEGFVVIN